MNNFFVKIEFLLCASAHLKAGFVSVCHVHDFWQMEIFRTGRARCIAGEDTFTLEQNDIFIVPPGMPHYFKYSDDSNIISVKFKASGNRTLYHNAFSLPDDPLKTVIVSAFFELADAAQSISAAEKIFMECLLSAIVAICDLNTPETSERLHPAYAKAVNFIEKNRHRSISAASVAHAIGCSSGHLASLFRKYSGTSLKNYIDEAKSAFIKQYLLYSDLSITDIAALAGFDDIYSFSRFFKRLAGVSPNAFRKNNKSPLLR